MEYDEEVDELDKLGALFKQHSELYLKEDPSMALPYKRTDLCAFVYLANKFPENDKDIIGDADHDEIYLDLEHDELAQLTEEDVIYLIRCGVMWDSSNESLHMFV